METIQYVNITHLKKQDAKDNFSATSPYGSGEVLCETAEMSIQELVYLHRHGMSWRRLPIIDRKMDTNLLYIDLDNDPKIGKGKNRKPDPVNPPPNLTKEELTEMLWEACAPTGPEGTNYIDWDFTSSTSGKPFKYHLFVTLRDRITNEDEYDRVMDDFEKRLEAAYMRLRNLSTSPVLRDTEHYPGHNVYAPSMKEVKHIGVCRVVGFDPKTGFIVANPEPHRAVTKKATLKKLAKQNLVPFREVPPSWSKLAHLLRKEGVLEREIIENPGADFNLGYCIHFLRKGKTKATAKLTVGERDTHCFILTLALYGQSRAYNLWMTRHGLADHRFTLQDMKLTLWKILKNSYEKGDEFSHDKFLRKLSELDTEYRAWSDENYVERFKMRDYKKNIARTRLDVQDATDRVIVEHTVGDRVIFSSVKDRDAALAEFRVSRWSLVRLAGAKGLVVEVAGSTPGKRGRKAGVTWESLAAIGKPYGSTFEYHGKLTSAQKKFVQRNGLTLKKLRANQGFTTDAEGEHVEPIGAPDVATWKMGTN